MRRLILCLLVLWAMAPESLAQAELTPTQLAELDAIEAEVARLRGLHPLAVTGIAFMPRQEADALLPQQFARFYPPDWIAAYHVFLRALDLAPADIDLPNLLYTFLTQSIGGYYDAYDKRMVIIAPPPTPDRTSLSLLTKLVVAHEYVHALQDQHFNLLAFSAESFEDYNFDAWLAQRALIEGDALMIEFQFLEQLRARDSATIDQELREAYELPMPATPAALPPIVERDFWFAYEAGPSFVYSVAGALGMDGINQAFTDRPPQTTEEIMVPQQYVDGKGALPVHVPDDSALLAEGWNRTYDSAVGEFYLRGHLGTQLQDRYAERVARGWGGDRLRVYTREPGGEMLWVWYQVWDRAYDAEQFITHYPQFLDRRYEQARRDGPCWVGETTHCLARMDERATRVTMAHDQDVALALLNMGP